MLRCNSHVDHFKWSALTVAYIVLLSTLTILCCASHAAAATVARSFSRGGWGLPAKNGFTWVEIAGGSPQENWTWVRKTRKKKKAPEEPWSQPSFLWSVFTTSRTNMWLHHPSLNWGPCNPYSLQARHIQYYPSIFWSWRLFGAVYSRDTISDAWCERTVAIALFLWTSCNYFGACCCSRSWFKTLMKNVIVWILYGTWLPTCAVHWCISVLANNVSACWRPFRWPNYQGLNHCPLLERVTIFRYLLVVHILAHCHVPHLTVYMPDCAILMLCPILCLTARYPSRHRARMWISILRASASSNPL